MSYTTEHLLDLLALAEATDDAVELREILHQGHEHYSQGLEETRAAVHTRYAELTDAQLAEELRRLGLPPAGADRPMLLAPLVLREWENTPAALAYGALAARAARRGVCLIPE
ncbi:hypothetical protein [Streptomyces xinghaiensis]|uniref:hypothetical protein n=1 Tax=Streptomyces xinghaiensis TaxID=1038928 RepID=UPI0002DC1EF9|nr:hypothetical protein [Streptomyces xinghaiensis]MZE80914.1 hypothetical protein [Streptomyces sp. SID5475]